MQGRKTTIHETVFPFIHITTPTPDDLYTFAVKGISYIIYLS